LVCDYSYETAELIRDRAAKCRRDRIQDLTARFHAHRLENESLTALADVRAPHLEKLLRSTLQGVPSGTMNVALGLIQRQDDSTWCAEVY
jgi:hypothetical protein